VNAERPDPNELDDPGEAGVATFGHAPQGTRPALGVPALASPVRQGMRAALLLFSWAVALEIVALAGVRLSSDPAENAWPAFVALGLYMGLFWALVASGVSLYLPKPARPTFWSTTVLLVFLAGLLWALTCAVAATPRVTA